MSDSTSRAKLLAELGFGHPAAAARAVELLADAGLTNPRKANISVEKRARVRALLEAALARLCDRCAGEDGGAGRERVPVARQDECEVCGGSASRAAIERCASALRASGMKRMVVLGGSPAARERLLALWPPDLDLRLVDGTGRHTAQEARTNLAWADVVIVWASTELAHKVSEHYSDSPKTVICPRRSIEALADAAATFAGRG